MTTATMTDEEFTAAVHAAIAELREPKDPDANRAAAADFVARFGTLGDLFDEPDLTQLQMAGPSGSAWDLIGHWSSQRGDPREVPAAGFEDHASWCQVCDYLEGVLALRTVFEHEACAECGGDLDAHDVGPDQFGKAHAFCRTVVWERREPLAAPAGDAAEYQVSDAYDARWVAPLSNGMFAVVTRTYYLGQVDGDGPHIEGVAPGELFLERQDEYLVCTDPNEPGSTEVGADLRHEIVPSDDPASEDPRALAEESFEPSAEEWEENAPGWARELLTGAGA